MKKKYWSRINRYNRKHRRLSLFEKIKYMILCSRADCILMDTPIHGNFGDHAIVQAQKQIFKDMGLGVTELPFPEVMLREKAFTKVIPKGKTIVVPGGGFLGCLWEDEENEFRRILQAFSDYSVVVFPQTVTFELESEEGRHFFEKSKEIYSSHKKLTLFVRDNNSLDFMKKNMPSVKCILAPDTVTVYKPKCEKVERHGILLCFRDDKERDISDEYTEQIRELIKKRFPNEKITTTDTINPEPIYPDDREKMVNDKLSSFASAKLVITDRLHGMIMSAITSTPCIAINNSNGKVMAQYEWIKNNDYVMMVEDKDKMPETLEAIDIDVGYNYDYATAYKNMEPLLDFVRRQYVKKG